MPTRPVSCIINAGEPGASGGGGPGPARCRQRTCLRSRASSVDDTRHELTSDRHEHTTDDHGDDDDDDDVDSRSLITARGRAGRQRESACVTSWRARARARWSFAGPSQQPGDVASIHVRCRCELYRAPAAAAAAAQVALPPCSVISDSRARPGPARLSLRRAPGGACVGSRRVAPPRMENRCR